jgi:tetratricopeptide (TPR) repeat protein
VTPAHALRAAVARALLVLGGAAPALGACAPQRGASYELAFAEAARAESAGRFAEAAGAYDRATLAAVRERDRDQARWDAAEMLARAGDLSEALARLDAIASDERGEHRAEAAYRAATLRVERGDAAQGWSAMEKVPRRFPGHGVAHAAVRRLVDHADEQGPRAGLEAARALERDLAGTELAPLAAFLVAEHLEALGDDAGALAAYLQIADRWPYPSGAFFDDSLWHASLLDEKLGRARAAVDDLERLVKERETTTIVGTYERPKYVPAMLRIGALWRDLLHDHARAREAYHRLYADYRNSTSRDDALWLEASLWREDGDLASACSRLGTLVHDFPDSRYVPCATRECAGLDRPATSRAPKECHPYIERERQSPPSSSSSSSSSSSRSSSSSSSNSSSSKSVASSSAGSSGSAVLRFSNLRSTPTSPSWVSSSSRSSSVSSPDHSSSRSVKNSKKSPLSRRRSISSTCSSLNASRMSSRSVSVSPSSIASCVDSRI